MLTIHGKGGRFCDGRTRRNFLKVGGLALGGLSLPQILAAESNAGISPSSKKGIIMVLLPGGPSHLDMYDLKPAAPVEIRGEFNPIRTKVPGIEICELLPRTAAIMDKLVVVRSLVGPRNDHNIHWCVTGWESHKAQLASPEISGYPPGGWPSIGAVLSKMKGPVVPGMIPSVDLIPTHYDARFICRTAPGESGCLGPAYSAFEVEAEGSGNISLDGISLDRLGNRRGLLSSLDRFRRKADQPEVMASLDSFSEQAYGVLTSSRLAEALNLEREDAKLLSRYGVDLAASPERGGQAHLDQFILARRVIEAGARCVTLVCTRYPFGRMTQGDYNWDWHTDNFNSARATLPILDIGLSALIEDLEVRGLLDDISVVVWGEFGRTPLINKNAGRDHWPHVGSALLAGGGMRTGQVLGASNSKGEYPSDRPVHFREIFATLYHNLGIDAARTQFVDLEGRPHYLLDHEPLSELV